MRAAIYARVSSSAQRERHTIENQLRVLPAFVQSHGWELVGTYIDDGRSAKAGKLDAREGFADLVRDAEARKFDLLVVVDVDRLTRTDSLEERARILGPFQRLGIDIVTPSGGRLDMRTMLGELWVTIQALGAAEENRKRAERIKAGKLRAIAEGRKPAGPTPFGLSYSRASGTWSIDEPAAAIVREIYERVTGGDSCVMIADDLSRRPDAPAPRTGWSRGAVYRIVRSRTACGEWSADKARGAVLRVPAIITEELWLAAARALLAHKRRGLARTKHVYLLEGLARCGDCGQPIAIRSECGTVGKRTGRKSPAAYVCRGRKLHRSCNAMIVRCEDLDAAVWAALCDELEQPELAAAIARLSADRAADARDWAGDVDTHRAHLARLEQVETKAMARYRAGLVSDGALEKELTALSRERRMVRDQLATAEHAISATGAAASRLGTGSSWLATLRRSLPSATPEQRRALLRELAQPRSIPIVQGRALLDVHLPIAASGSSSGAGDVVPIVHALSAGYRTEHEAIGIATLRIRRVA